MKRGPTYVTLTKSVALPTRESSIFYLFFSVYSRRVVRAHPLMHLRWREQRQRRLVGCRPASACPPVRTWPACPPPPLRTSSAVGLLHKMHARTKMPKCGAKFLDCPWGKFIISSFFLAVTLLHKGRKYMCYREKRRGIEKLRYIEELVIWRFVTSRITCSRSNW